jgi:hypothetical protein
VILWPQHVAAGTASFSEFLKSDPRRHTKFHEVSSCLFSVMHVDRFAGLGFELPRAEQEPMFESALHIQDRIGFPSYYSA